MIERLLNHREGSLSPIALIDNRASYLKEMTQALAIWEAHLSGLFRLQKAA